MIDADNCGMEAVRPSSVLGRSRRVHLARERSYALLQATPTAHRAGADTACAEPGSLKVHLLDPNGQPLAPTCEVARSCGVTGSNQATRLAFDVHCDAATCTIPLDADQVDNARERAATLLLATFDVDAGPACGRVSYDLRGVDTDPPHLDAGAVTLQHWLQPDSACRAITYHPLKSSR